MSSGESALLDYWQAKLNYLWRKETIEGTCLNFVTNQNFLPPPKPRAISLLFFLPVSLRKESCDIFLFHVTKSMWGMVSAADQGWGCGGGPFSRAFHVVIPCHYFTQCWKWLENLKSLLIWILPFLMIQLIWDVLSGEKNLTQGIRNCHFPYYMSSLIF